MSTYPRFVVNGVDMTDSLGRWALDPSQPHRTLAAPRNVTVTIPGREGVLALPNAGREAPPFAIHLIVMGRGVTMDERIADLEANLDALHYLFGSTGYAEVSLQTSATTIYNAFCRITASVTPERVGLDNAKVTYLLDIPAGGWSGSVQGSYTGTALNASGGSVHTLGFLSGSVRPVTGLKIMVTGPFPIFAITDRATRQNISIPVNVPVGRFLRIDCDAQQAHILTVNSWTADGTDVSGNAMLFGPGSDVSWFRPTPVMVNGDPSNREVLVEMAVGPVPASPRPVTIIGRKAL